MFEAVVFGGGGTRCFWQGGFMDAARRDCGIEPKAISAVSGGTLAAVAFVTQRGPRLLEAMGEVFDRHDSNVEPSALLGPGDFLVHENVYREVVERTFGDADAQQAVAEGPAFDVLMARPSGLGCAATIALYELDLKLRGSPHTAFAQRAGAKPVEVDGRAVAREGRLVDMIVAAANVPPVFDAATWQGGRVIDGGVIDNAPPPRSPLPQRSPDDTGPTTLYVLTRPYRSLPKADAAVYACPSEDPPTFKLDFTDREGIEATWELGARDGAAFARQWGG